MARKSRIHGESIFSVLLALLGLCILLVSLTIGFGSLKNPGSGLFPFLVGVLIFIQSIAVFITEKSATEESPLTRKQIQNVLLMSVTFVLWIVLMPYLGYILVTFLIVLAFSKILSLEGWLKPLILSFGTTGLCFVLFDLVMYLDLPRGPLG